MATRKQKKNVERRFSSTAADLEALHKLGLSPTECVEIAICAPSVEILIERAQIGEEAASRELLGVASAYLNNSDFGPMPSVLRRYLGNALAKASIGHSADLALNLKPVGRPRQEHRTRQRIAHWIFKAMHERGKTLEVASFELQERIEAGIRKHGAFYGYAKSPEAKTLLGIYCELAQEIKATYLENTARFAR